MYVAFAYLQVFLHFCSPQQLPRGLYLYHLELVFAAGVPLFFASFAYHVYTLLLQKNTWIHCSLLFYCINCALTLTTFLSFLSICTFLLHKFHLHSDFDLVLVSIPLFLPCLFRPFCRWIFSAISDIEFAFVFLSLFAIVFVFIFVSIPLFLPCLSYLDPFVGEFPSPSLTSGLVVSSLSSSIYVPIQLPCSCVPIQLPCALVLCTNVLLGGSRV